MALTPHEEREIHQIEESLSGSDPGFAARMSGRLPVRRKLLLGGLCLLLVAVAFAFFARSAWVVSVTGAAVATFLAGWCVGRMGPLDLRSVPRRVLGRTARAGKAIGRVLTRPFRWRRRRNASTDR